MPISADIIFHATREQSCRRNAALARDPETAAIHRALADLHAERRREIETQPELALESQPIWPRP